MEPKRYYVYLLRSMPFPERTYIGFTTNLPQRLEAHFQGRNTSTAPRRPLTLIHTEYYLAKADAERREVYLKSTKGRRQN